MTPAVFIRRIFFGRVPECKLLLRPLQYLLKGKQGHVILQDGGLYGCPSPIEAQYPIPIHRDQQALFPPGRGELWRLVIPDPSAADIIAEQALALLGKHILLACTLQDKPVLINAGLFPKGTAHIPQA